MLPIPQREEAKKRSASSDSEMPPSKRPRHRDGEHSSIVISPGVISQQSVRYFMPEDPNSPNVNGSNSNQRMETENNNHENQRQPAHQYVQDNQDPQDNGSIQTQQMIIASRKEIETLKSAEMSLKTENEVLRTQLSTVRNQADKMGAELKNKSDKMRNREMIYREMEGVFRERVASEMRSILIETERTSRVAIRERLTQQTVRLGYVSYGLNGEEYKEGTAAKELKEKEKKLEEMRESFELAKKKLAKRKVILTSSNPGSTSNNNNNSTLESSSLGHSGQLSSSNGNEMSFSPFGGAPTTPAYSMTPEKELEDILMQEQLFKLKLAALKVEESEIAREKDVIRTESILHWKELRRFQEEESSKFNHFPLLHKNRYLMLQLLGRGGFSEVYRAYDLQEFRPVACKIHQLSPEWSQEKKSNYLRHAERECEIHKALVHPRVVALYDIFEIDKDSFCTVLQYCKGGDLDSYLKQHKSLAEAEARVLIAQLFDGLKYLATRGQKIIHYDLKPGNILFDENGCIKIADFGLSKIMEANTDAMELTSQGAGTYWYLPPECFDREKPQISSKVDVWSAGVILYQMLYGCKPFGNNMSQKVIMERNLIHSNLQVDFPASKKISEEAKVFLQRCLTASVRQRPDVVELSSDPFLAFTVAVSAKKSSAGVAAGAAKNKVDYMPPPSPSPAKLATPPKLPNASPAKIATTTPTKLTSHSLASLGPSGVITGPSGGTLTFIRK